MSGTLTWPDGRTLALSIVVNVEEGSEMTIADGDKKPEPVDELGIALNLPIRNYGNESNYRYGIVAGGPRIFKLLGEYDVAATITAAALALERAPELTELMVSQGHEICSHGWRWTHTFSMKEDRERDTIAKAVESFQRTTGHAPAGWLSRYLHTENTRRLLSEAGFLYHMDDYSRDVPFWEPVTLSDGSVRPLVCVPYALDTNDMKMWVAPAMTPGDWLDYACRTFDWLRAEAAEEGPRIMSLGLHLRIIGRPGRIWALKAFLDHVSGHEDVWITTRKQIAERFAECCPWVG
ncbi:polysaccharide deacetylase family protein [Hoeflea sp.]|uniref:polysaccharide deacetylase family protein n=1 Tax=Hoeflea sp. TaxID=1940281 RepID=UPI003B010EC1